jgi:ribosome-binding factor A
VKEFDRTERIGAELKRELYEVLRDEVRDPRLADLTIHEVRVVKDLSHAKVFFTCLPTVGDAAAGLDTDGTHGVAQTRLLNGRLAGFLRHALAQRVRLRTMPELHFVYDESIGAGMRLSALIDHAVEGLADPAEDDTDGGADDQGNVPTPGATPEQPR